MTTENEEKDLPQDRTQDLQSESGQKIPAIVDSVQNQSEERTEEQAERVALSDASVRTTTQDLFPEQLKPQDASQANEFEPQETDVDDEALPSESDAEHAEFVQKLPWILEAMLFSMDKPATAVQLSQVLKTRHRDVDVQQVKQALRSLVESYQNPDRRVGMGFELLESGGAWLFSTHADFADYVNGLHASKPQRLSRAALEALSVIAYRQPVTRPQIDDVRGVDSSSAVRYLLDKQMVRVLGKSEELGRPLLYGTTSQFLQLLGLKSLSHLPTLQEFQELDEEHQARVEQAHGAEPVQVVDLVNDEGRVVSDETENASEQALQALESALQEADESRRESEQILRPLDEQSTQQAQDAEGEQSAQVVEKIDAAPDEDELSAEKIIDDAKSPVMVEAESTHDDGLSSDGQSGDEDNDN